MPFWRRIVQESDRGRRAARTMTWRFPPPTARALSTGERSTQTPNDGSGLPWTGRPFGSRECSKTLNFAKRYLAGFGTYPKAGFSITRKCTGFPTSVALGDKPPTSHGSTTMLAGRCRTLSGINWRRIPAGRGGTEEYDVYAQSSPPTKMMVNYRCGPQYSHMRFRWILRADRVKRNRAADAEQFHKGAEGPFRQELSACPNREDSWGAFPEQADVESRGCSKQTPRDHKVSRTSTGNEYPH